MTRAILRWTDTKWIPPEPPHTWCQVTARLSVAGQDDIEIKASAALGPRDREAALTKARERAIRQTGIPAEAIEVQS